MRNHIGDIAVDKDVARWQADDLVGGNPRVRTTDPEIFRRLLVRSRSKNCGSSRNTPSTQARLLANSCWSEGSCPQDEAQCVSVLRRTKDEDDARCAGWDAKVCNERCSFRHYCVRSGAKTEVLD